MDVLKTTPIDTSKSKVRKRLKLHLLTADSFLDRSHSKGNFFFSANLEEKGKCALHGRDGPFSFAVRGSTLETNTNYPPPLAIPTHLDV